MGIDAKRILQSNWRHFTANGATKKCTFQAMADSAYTPGGAVVKEPSVEIPGIEVVFDMVKEVLVDGSTIRSIDRVAIFPALDISPVVPSINDLIVDPSGREWIVKDVQTDPMEAQYSLRVRPVS